MSELRFVDVFTETIGQGNRAGVVLDAAGLSAPEMQAIAAEAGVSETAFGVPSKHPAEYDLEVRYFSRLREIPICGHATIAFHHLRATLLDLPAQTLRVKTGAGVLPIDIERTNGELRVVMTQGAPRIERTLEPAQIDSLLVALGLTRESLMSNLPVQAVTTGHGKVLVPIRHYADLNALRPDRERLVSLAVELGFTGFFVFTFDRNGAGVLYHARMFSPAVGVDEDPVTGNAHGPTGFYLATHGLLSLPHEGNLRYRARQGEAMGRPGEIEVLLSGAGGVVNRVQVTGNAVIVPGN